jgi:hypothetical protein
MNASFLRKHLSKRLIDLTACLRTDIFLRSVHECREYPSVHSADIESDRLVSVPYVEVVHPLALAFFGPMGDAWIPLVSALGLRHSQSARIPAFPV